MQRNKNIYLIALIFLVLIAAIGLLTLYFLFFKPNTGFSKEYKYVYIPTGASFSQMMDTLQKNQILKSRQTFLIASRIKRFHSPRAGRYKIIKGMNNNQIINVLRAGLQSPVRVTFNNIRTKQELAGRIARQIEADSLSIINLLNDDQFLKQFGFSSQDILAMFIPNTYQFFWNTSAQGFIKRMYREYRKFWTPERLQKARQIGLTPKQVIILASIVQAEQMRHPDERPRIAGLYINRLHRGMPLQSDPTLIYAWKDFSIRRVYNYHKEINSPYNTYKYPGLPPGPILTPDISSINAVLNYEKHDYLYMVARADFSGYHHFSRTLSEHEAYARRYRQALNRAGIR